MEPTDIIGKTIANVIPMTKDDFDDQAWLRLEFTDGTSCIIEARYGGHTGDSEHEYPAYISVKEAVDDLVPMRVR